MQGGLECHRKALSSQYAAFSEEPGDIPFDPQNYLYLGLQRRCRLNLEDLCAGDVFLRGNSGWSLAARFVRVYQRRLLGPAVAGWTHVGVYDGSELIWDAMPGRNVQACTLSHFCNVGTHIAVVRYRHQALAETALKASIAKFADADYALASHAPVLAQQLIVATGQRMNVSQRNERKAICSTFVANVLKDALGTLGAGVMSDIRRAVPAHFRVHDDFRQVEINWFRGRPAA